MSEPNKFGKFFRKTLRESKYSGARLARELDVQPQRIQHWQARGVSAQYAPKVAEMLGVPPAKISRLEGAEGFTVVKVGTAVEVSEAQKVYAALTPSKQMSAVMAIADSASPEDAITFAEYFLARAKAGLQEKK